MCHARDTAAVLALLVASVLANEPTPVGAAEVARVALFEALPAYADHLTDPAQAATYRAWLVRSAALWQAREAGNVCRLPFFAGCRGERAPRSVKVLALLAVGT